MASFIHIANAQDAEHIRKRGLHTTRSRQQANWLRWMRPNIPGSEWMRYDREVMRTWPRTSRMRQREYNILRGYGGKALRKRRIINDRGFSVRGAFETRYEIITVRGVYLMPLVENEQIAFGWTREIGKKFRSAIAVHVHLADNEIVYVGRYTGGKERMTAAEAVALIRSLEATSAQYYEVILPRAVTPREIRRIVPIRKITGWRNWPGAHGHRPWRREDYL